MAKKTQMEDDFTKAPRLEMPASAHRTTSELPPTRKIEQNGQVYGIFINAKLITIMDTDTKLPKELMCYTFRDRETEEKFSVLGGRTGLDAAFTDLATDVGGWEKLTGMIVLINRGTDVERSGGRKGSIGQYEIGAWSAKEE
jgi:hypothetical protein